MRARSGLLVALALLAALAAWLLLQRGAPETGVAAVLSPSPAAPRPSFEASAPDAFAVELPDGQAMPVGEDPASKESPTAPVAAQDANCIAGTVAYTTGEPVGPGVHVVAWLPGEPPSDAALASAIATATDPGAGERPLSALTDDASAFRIEGLQAGASYTVCAAGRGLYTPSKGMPWRVSAGTTDLKVTVARVHGVRVVIRDENGELPLTNPALGSRGPVWSLPTGALQIVWTGLPLMGLVGLSEDDVAPIGRDGVVLLCLAGAEPPGPAHVGGQVAGYEAYHREIPLTPLGEGLQTEEIRLHRTSDAFARLTVETLGAGPVLEPADTSSLEGTRNSPWVELAPVGEEQKSIGFSLTLGRLPWHGVTFDNVPAGRYHVRLWTTHRFLSVPFEDQPMREFEILPGDNRLSFDVGTVGAIELDVHRADGRPWQRHVNVEMVCEAWGSNIREQAIFTRPPYVLEGLPAGRYRLTMTYPSRAEADADADGFFRVDGARLQTVVVREHEDAPAGR